MTATFRVIFALILSAVPVTILPQARQVFSGDPERYRTELLSFMGANLSEEQLSNVNAFLVKWDSSLFSGVNRYRILDLSSQLAGRQMRAVPHFYEFLKTLNDFVDYKRDVDFLSYWLMGLSETLFGKGMSNESLVLYFRNTSLLIRENILYNSGTVRWKVKHDDLRYIHDTVFKIMVSNATLTCYSQKDSTEIYNVSGAYIPDIQQFIGNRGTVTWEKAGYPRDDVYAEMLNYRINLTRNSFSCDSARLIHKTYFGEPVYGELRDQATSATVKERAVFPRFETYMKHFRIKNIYEGVDYEGGLLFEGASVKGKGEAFNPAKISLSRNDTLFMKLRSPEFTFSINALTCAEAESSLYLGSDSIYHSNLGFSYNVTDRQASLLRTNNPISRSPYYNSYHNLDMYFESLLWDMKGSRVVLSRARGASLGQAVFESVSSFNAKYFLQLMGLDQYHPLSRLKQFSEWYYSETFPVTEFAKWLNKSEEAVTGLCIDLANRGFIFYDRASKEVTLKKKVTDFIDFFTRKKDYDVISVISETKAPVDNAVLDLNDFRIRVNGVRGVFLSDSQRVAIYPYQQKLAIGKNRSLEFDGVVEAGLFTIFGHDFNFNYDTFKIRLQSIDSIKVAVETDKRDSYGNPLFRQVDNMIQLATAELYIDDPQNKSGLRSLEQYPIINAVSDSYIFFDRIPGLEGVYAQEDFYFKVDPFTYENIDHYKMEFMNLPGEFHGGKILQPMRQNLVILENNSLGFNMSISEGGIDLYEGKGRLFDFISMSNSGLRGGGKLSHLTATTISDEYRFYPDSMITTAKVFTMNKDASGIFPELASQDVQIKWMPPENEWLAVNSAGKPFNMFDNGTTLAGSLTLKPSEVGGSGTINMPDSRIVSNNYIFTAGTIHADTADYNLKSASTSGDAFIAENAATDISFDRSITRFHLNTGSSVVKFPELQYICTMTDFEYNMKSRILEMEQRGRSSGDLMTPAQLLRVDMRNPEKPTFFSTNAIRDTLTFASGKARYYVNEEYLEAENVNYIRVADALIQPENGRMTIDRRAKVRQFENAIIAVNNRHLLHSAKVSIESPRRYSGGAVYDYIGENREIQQISFPHLSVDTLTTTARGFIAASQQFTLSPAFTFTGDVLLSARSDLLFFTGAAGIVHDCTPLRSYTVKFSGPVDPVNVMIPVSEKPRDTNDNLVYSGSFINIDSIHIYPAFLSSQKSWSDVSLVSSSGYLWFDRGRNRYLITSREKIADPGINGNLLALDKGYCVLSGEGSLNFGTNFDLMKMRSAGSFIHSLDSGRVTIEAILALDFHFSSSALSLMSSDIRTVPSLRPVSINTDLNTKGMRDLLGAAAANRLREDLNLFGSVRNIPKEFTYELLLNDVKLYWNEASSSFRSEGRIGIGFIGVQPINVYVDGYIEIQRRRTGDMIDVYLKADESTWFYFSYFRGVMMAQAGNYSFNTIISKEKLKDRRDPSSNTRVPYTYMVAVEDRLARFLRRMSSREAEQDLPVLDGLIR